MTTRLQKYPKVRRFGTAEVQGILNGTVEISEKLDGSNARLWYNGKDLIMGSRNHSQATFGQEFNGGLGKWVDDNEPMLVELFEGMYRQFTGRFMLVGEFMRKHAINYGINKPYVVFYDVMEVDKTGTEGRFVTDEQRRDILDFVATHKFHVNFPLFVGEITQEELIERFTDLKSTLNSEVTMEGVVIKNSEYTNQYGRQCHAKLLNESFQELKGSKVKQRKNTIDYSPIVEQFVTPQRVSKLIEKNDLPLDLKSMKELSKLVPEDVLLEEILTIRAAVDVLDFGMFQKQVCMRTVKVINELLLQVDMSQAEPNCPKCGWEGKGPHTTAKNPSNALTLCKAKQQAEDA